MKIERENQVGKDIEENLDQLVAGVEREKPKVRYVNNTGKTDF